MTADFSSRRLKKLGLLSKGVYQKLLMINSTKPFLPTKLVPSRNEILLT